MTGPKLTASYLNGLAIAVLAIGGLAPFFSHIYDPNSAKPLLLVAPAGGICLIISGALHLDCTQSSGRSRGMSNLEFLVAFSIVPVGALVLGVVVYLLTSPRRRHPHAAE